MLYELKKIRKQSGLSQAEAASLFNVPLNTWRGWEQCKHIPKDNAMLKHIADYFHVSIEALFGYDMIDYAYISLGNEAKIEDAFIRRHVYFEISAGEPIWMQETELELPAPAEVLSGHPGAFFLKVNGDSMNRVLPNGCYAFIDPDSVDVPDGTACAVCVDGCVATIKRVHHITNGLMLAPDSYNKDNKPIIYDYDVDDTPTVTIIGEVIWFMPPFDCEL